MKSGNKTFKLFKNVAILGLILAISLSYFQPGVASTLRGAKMTIRICSVEGCRGKHLSQSYCNKHYLRMKKSGNLKIKKINTKTNCSIKDCDGKYFAKDYCQKHYTRVRRTGSIEMTSRARSKEEVYKSISEQSIRNGDCIEFTGVIFTTGYGQVCYKGKYTTVSRFMWEYHHGPISKGMFVCHKCDNRPCFNIDHLFLGTPQDNITDMINKGRGANQKKTHCKRGHPFSGDNLYINPTKGTRRCRACVKILKENWILRNGMKP